MNILFAQILIGLVFWSMVFCYLRLRQSFIYVVSSPPESNQELVTQQKETIKQGLKLAS